MSPESQFSIEAVLKAPLKHKFKALAAFVVPVVFAALAVNSLPNTYRSDAMIFVRLGRESVSLDPTATTGSLMPVVESRENEVNSIRDMLYSGGLLAHVVDRMGPEVVLGDAPLGDIPDDFPEPPDEDVTDSPRQQAIQLLTEKLSVFNSRKSSVLIANCEAASPQLAQKILEVFLDAYKRMHSIAHQTAESNEFFAQQSKLLQTQWRDALEKLREAKERAGVVSISGMQDNLKLQTNDAQSRLMNVESALMATEARLKTLQELASKPMNARGLREDLKTATSALASLTAERDILSKQIKALAERAVQLNRDEVVIRQLEKEVDGAETNYVQYQELFEQTRIEEALLSSKLSNVRVVQDPSFVPKPTGPKRKVIVGAGVFVGAAGAMLISLLFELFLGGTGSFFRPRESATAPPSVQVPVGSQGSLV